MALQDVPNQDKRGHHALAAALGVAAWSTEFYQIIFMISERADELLKLVAQLDLDEDLKAAAVGHIGFIKRGFGEEGLNNQWSHAVTKLISPEHAGPIRMLSPMVRQLQPLPKLDAAELDELIAAVDELRGWLADHQLADQDFIRQALIEGLDQFRFRVGHLQWVGWGYALRSLREVIGAYLALERGMPDAAAAPDADAMLRKTGAFLKSVHEKVKFAKDVKEAGDFVLKMYGAASLLLTAKGGIAGLLS